MLFIFALQAISTQAGMPMMTVPAYSVPAVPQYYPVPALNQPYFRAPSTLDRQFGPYLGQAPPAQYVPVVSSATPQSPALKKVVRKPSVKRGVAEYDKSRTPGADSFVRSETSEYTQGRYGLDESKQRKTPYEVEGARYGSGYGPKGVPQRKSTYGVKLDEEFDDETSGSVLGSVVALLMGMVVGSTVTYVVAKPRMISKKMGSPEPLLSAV
jgi:hypothetical protein